MRVLWLSFVLVVGCGGAATEPPRTANDTVTEDSSVTEGSTEESPAEESPAEESPAEESPAEESPAEGRSVAQDAAEAQSPVAASEDDELQGLERDDLSGHQAAPESAASTTGVARSRAGGQLDTRRAGVHVGHRRARTVSQTLDDEAVGAVIDEHVSEAHYCYRRAFGDRPDVQGRVEVEAVIGTDGHVSEARISRSTIRSDQVDRCIVEAFRRWRFPTAPSTTRVEHSFRLGSQ